MGMTPDVLDEALEAARGKVEALPYGRSRDELHGAILLASWVQGFTRDRTRDADQTTRETVAQGLTHLTETAR